MIIFVFTKTGEKAFKVLQKPVQDRLLNKLKELKCHDDIFALLKRLHHFEPATHRLRVGDYRLILELVHQTSEEIKFLVLDVGDRKNIYKV